MRTSRRYYIEAQEFLPVPQCINERGLLVHKIFIQILLIANVLVSCIQSTVAEDYISDLYANYTLIECELIPKPRKSPRCRLPYKSDTFNWAGYEASLSPNQVTFATGTWIMPMKYPNNPIGFSSIWVGIDDGAHIAQIGIEWDTNNAYAWYEMFPAGLVVIGGFPFDVDDSITSTVTYIGGNLFTLTLANNTRQVFFTTTQSQSANGRSRCEWINERPFFGGPGFPPLTRFCPCQWSNCMATFGGITGTISAFNFDPITMVSSAPLAIPSALSPDGSSFEVTWVAATN